MTSYANLHFALETQRQRAQDSLSRGPRVLIVGSEHAGKTTLAKILVAYAVRQGRTPVVVGLDPREASQ
jgi:polyribonucleotide 5'-hydroxyl-kinase